MNTRDAGKMKVSVGSAAHTAPFNSQWEFPMMRIILAAAVGLLVLVGRSEAQGVAPAPAAPAKPQAQSRSDHLLYSIPGGWKREERDQYSMLVPTDLPQGRQVEIRLWPAKALVGGTLDAAANAELERLKATFTQVQTMPLNSVRHE